MSGVERPWLGQIFMQITDADIISSSSTDETFVHTRINRLVLRFILALGYIRNGDEEPKSAAQVRERVHAHHCFSENCSVLPDYDVHH